MQDAHVCVDLAWAQPVRLGTHEFRRPSDIAPWLERCAALYRVRHPHLVQIIDYGVLGTTSTFEALRMPSHVCRWRARDALTSRAIDSAVDWLLRQGLSAGRLSWRRVVEIDGRPMLVPDHETGWSVGSRLPVGCPAGKTSREVIGPEQARVATFLRLCALGRPKSLPPGFPRNRMPAAAAVAEPEFRLIMRQISELFEDGRPGEPRQVHLKGPLGSIVTAVDYIAREARLRGFIPLSTACLPPSPALAGHLAVEDLVHLTGSSHVLAIHWRNISATPSKHHAVRLLLELGLASTRPHVLLILEPGETSAGHGLRLSASATFKGDEVAEPWSITAASHVQGQPVASNPIIARACEPHAAYRIGGPSQPPDPASATVAIETEFPAAAHARARNRCFEGLGLAKRGRHAAGERLLRDATAALARRGDSAWAGWGSLNLGRVLHRRGRTRDAVAAYEQARTFFDRCEWTTASIRSTVYLGLVWTDDGRLREAEAALRAAAIAAAESGSVPGRELARLGLARCLVWQRRWEEAREILAEGRAVNRVLCPAPAGGANPRESESTHGWKPAIDVRCRETPSTWRWDDDVDAAVMTACLESRSWVGTGDLCAAGRCAAQAMTRARHTAEARDLAAAQTAAARVHAEIADIDGLRCLVRDGLRETMRAHAPLEALRLRLLLVDGLRRSGHAHEADRLAHRLRRIRPESLPVVLRRRIEAVAHGQLSTDVDAAQAGGRPTTPLGKAEARGLATQAPEGDQIIIADVIDLLSICHDVGDDLAMMERIAGYVRQQTRASSIAFFGAEPSGLVSVAGSGTRPPPIEVASRARDTSLNILPADAADPPEAAVPVRYAGATIGALACRWPVDRQPRPDRLEAILTAAATLAAPAVRAALDRRACPQAVSSAEPSLMGAGDLMNRLCATITRAAVTPFPVLIEGESGTGKELVARAIHRLSPRRDRKCHTLNCAALTDELLEAELFGHARGAFTGAIGDRAGLFEDADGGTVVLDEVGELSARAQAKLLRTLQEGEIRRVGENVTRSVDVRIIAAANRPLQDEVASGRFRRDLFYRLAVIRVTVPPLRERVDDIPMLATHFWTQAVSRTGSRATLAPSTIAALARYDWPGNVRELQNVMTALAVSVPRRGRVGPASLPPAITALGAVPSRTTLSEARRAFEIRYVRAALAQAGGRRGRAARELGLSRQGFAKVLARLNFDATDP